VTTDTDSDAVLTFRSTFRVLRADRLLAPHGLAHGLAPTPDGVESPCGLSVHLPNRHVAAARAALAAADNEPEAVYRRGPQGWAPSS